MWLDEGGLIFYLVYEFERLRLLPGLDRSISNNCSSSNRTNNARAGFAPDELLGSGTTQPVRASSLLTHLRQTRDNPIVAWHEVPGKGPPERAVP